MLETTLQLGRERSSFLLNQDFSKTGLKVNIKLTMGMYVNKVKFFAKEFISIAIIQTPRHDVRHADMLAYLATALEVDSPRTLHIDI